MTEPWSRGKAKVMGIFGSDPLAVGETAPSFELKNQKGETVRSAEVQRPMVIFFYPKDDTPVCTQEACLFRDNYDGIQEADAEVFGISSDSTDSHKSFAERHGMPFDLLSDPKGAIRKAFKVPSTMGVLPGRVTFVIDREGVIRHVTNSQLSAQKHVTEALAALKAL
ncbi:MAG: peroxiredoxin [Myxococcota bacterium]